MPYTDYGKNVSPLQLLHSISQTPVKTTPLKHKLHHGTALLQLAMCHLHFKVPAMVCGNPQPHLPSVAYPFLHSSSDMGLALP